MLTYAEKASFVSLATLEKQHMSIGFSPYVKVSSLYVFSTDQCRYLLRDTTRGICVSFGKSHYERPISLIYRVVYYITFT